MIWGLRQLKTLIGSYERANQNVVGMNRRNIAYVYPRNARSDYPLVDDKVQCKQLLTTHGVPTALTLDVCHGLFDVERTLDSLVRRSDFVVKPANASGGKGILVLGERQSTPRGNTERISWNKSGGGSCDPEELRTHLGNIVFGAFGHHLNDRALVEQRVRPSVFFHSLWPDGLCDLRVIVVDGTPVMAMLRVPTRRSGGKANLHQGGVGVAVDIETGHTRRASIKGREIQDHPETGKRLVGATIPAWSHVLEVAAAAASTVPLGYLGVDIVMDEAEQPLVLELNARPGLEIQNVNGFSLESAVARGGVGQRQARAAEEVLP